MRMLGALLAFGVHAGATAALAIVVVFWWHARDLPSTAQLAEYQPATLSRVYSNDGALLAEFSRERRLFSPIDEVPDLVKHAFISAEDKNFYIHDGVDYIGVAKASVDNVRRIAAGRRLRGASTITQQVVKNFLLSGDRAISRKIREILLAWRLETVLTKEQILELYLNEIFLGLRTYGVTTAAQRYFGKKLEDLTPPEAAYLAALPKAPSTYHPIRRKELATERRDYVLREMFENGYIDLVTYEESVAAELDTILDDDSSVNAARTLTQRPPPIDFFSEEIRRELIRRFTAAGAAGGALTDGALPEDAAAGDLAGAQEDAEAKVYGGGLVIRATVDPELQDLARRTLQTGLWRFSRDRGYAGPAARLEPEREAEVETETETEGAAAEDAPPPLDFSDIGPEAVWRERLDDLDLPGDVQPWRRAVVLAVEGDRARLGVENVYGEEPASLLFSDVSEWAAERRGEDPATGEAILGDAPTAPGDVWSVGDVIYVEPVEGGADGAVTWSMRQLPSINGALVALDPRTGRVLAMQGGFSFDASVFNRATQAKRQPGSAIKPFVYAAALENGYQPNTIILDAPVTLPQLSGETWKPRNYSGRFYGPAPLRWGIEKSHNLMTVRLAMDVGLETVADYTERLGVYEEMPLLYSYALGSGESTLMQMTASYAIFANGGRLISPTLIDRIQDRHGRTIYRHDERVCTGCADVEWSGQGEPYVVDDTEQALDPVTAFQVVSMLRGVTQRGTATSVGSALPFEVAGKTGTTNDARDAWFVGFTPELAVGCYIGYDTPRPMGPGASGGRLCAPVFTDFMSEAAATSGDGLAVAAADGRPETQLEGQSDAVDARAYPTFRRPAGAVLLRINRNNGCVVSRGAQGEGYITEAFRLETAPGIGSCPRNDFDFLGSGVAESVDGIVGELDDAFGGVGASAGDGTGLSAGPAPRPGPLQPGEIQRPGGQAAAVDSPPRPPRRSLELRTDGLY